MPPYMYTDKQPCGTKAAYQRHVYHGEDPCLPCTQANRRSIAEHRAKAARAITEYRAEAKREGRRRARAAAPTGWQPGFVVDVSGLLDYCEAIEPEWDREAAMGDAF